MPESSLHGTDYMSTALVRIMLIEGQANQAVVVVARVTRKRGDVRYLEAHYVVVVFILFFGAQR